MSTQQESPRFLFHFNASPLMTEVGLGTKTTNLVWPATIAGNHDDLFACLTPPNRRLVVLWNTKRPVLADVRTHEALAMITDVASITAALPGKHTISDGSLFPPGMWLHTKAPRVPWSAAKAKRVLADAGWLPGVDGIGRNAGNKFEFSLLLVAGFKNINDSLGHGIGDLLLQRAADRLRQGVRPADLVARADPLDAESNLARLGGGEFTVLVPSLHHADDALGLAHRIHDLLRRPFILDGREIVITASIGIALFPDDGADAEALLMHADTAMYHAKDEGRDNCQFYRTALTVEAMRRLTLESSRRQAIERGEFFMAYQPQLDLASGRVLSLEALIRWRHPERGLVSPMEFIPATEESGLIVLIGEWVLRAACADAARWVAAGTPVRVAVNLSAVQFMQPELVRSILYFQ